jgi:Mn2+/Fe2+ NRAMP family transporter
MSAVDGARGRVRRRLAKRPRWPAAVLGFPAILGPGLTSANVGNDAGGIITYASTGSRFGYRMLFLMVLITVALVVVQEMCARLGAYTGEALGALIREQFPLRSGAAAMVLLFIANAGLTVSEFAGVGASMEIFGVSRQSIVLGRMRPGPAAGQQRDPNRGFQADSVRTTDQQGRAGPSGGRS